jgi:hypothetical protein
LAPSSEVTDLVIIRSNSKLNALSPKQWRNYDILKEMSMNLIELFQKTGLGIMATASKDGSVNTAVYARPHVRPRYLREDLQRLDNL